MSTGDFIVIEGLDGSGKKTQSEMAVCALEKAGVVVRKTEFPQYVRNLHGQLIRECLDGKHGDFLGLDPRIASVLYADDRRESAPKIRKWLDSGCVVISDRYVGSNQIHQGGKFSDPIKRREFLSWLSQLEYSVNKIPKPTVVLFLDTVPEIANVLRNQRAESGQSQDVVEKSDSYHQNSYQSAKLLLQQENNWIRIRCCDERGQMLSREDIHSLVMSEIAKIIGRPLVVAGPT